MKLKSTVLAIWVFIIVLAFAIASTVLLYIAIGDFKSAKNDSGVFIKLNKINSSIVNILRSELNIINGEIAENFNNLQNIFNNQSNNANHHYEFIESQYKNISIKLNELSADFKDRNPLTNNCQEVLEKTKRSGVYSIVMSKISSESFKVACELDTSGGGGWTVVLRRLDGSVDFNRNWNDYKRGFGDVHGEFFIGLDKLHKMLTDGSKKNEMYFKLTNFENISKTYFCNDFMVGNESSGYEMTVGECDGNAGDSINYHNGMKFSTFDVDNDLRNDYNCALEKGGGWWYRNCYQSLLTGPYIPNKETGVRWNEFSTEKSLCNMKFADVLIRPKIEK